MVNFIASKVAPIPSQYDYWVDLTESPYGGIVKYWDGKVWDYVNNKDELDFDIETIKNFLSNLLQVGMVDTFVGTVTPESTQVNLILSKNKYTINEDGTITSTTETGDTLNIPSATSTLSGVMSSTDKAKLDTVEQNANNYVLPAASAEALGGIKIGTAGEDEDNKMMIKIDGNNCAYIDASTSVYDGLDSDSIFVALSAAQGKVLKGLCDALTTKYSELEARIEALETYDYLTIENDNAYLSCDNQYVKSTPLTTEVYVKSGSLSSSQFYKNLKSFISGTAEE